MNPHDIKALLGKKGVRQTQVAEGLGVSPSMVNGVIFQRIKSRRVAMAIARAIGQPLAELWPDIYGPAAVGRAATRRAKHTARTTTPTTRRGGAKP